MIFFYFNVGIRIKYIVQIRIVATALNILMLINLIC